MSVRLTSFRTSFRKRVRAKLTSSMCSFGFHQSGGGSCLYILFYFDAFFVFAKTILFPFSRALLFCCLGLKSQILQKGHAQCFCFLICYRLFDLIFRLAKIVQKNTRFYQQFCLILNFFFFAMYNLRFRSVESSTTKSVQNSFFILFV